MPLLDRDDCVLVVIDAQAGFLDKVDAEVAADVVDRIRWLVTLAAVLEIPVKVTEEEPERNDPTAKPIRNALPANAKRHVKPTFGLAGSPEILADLEATGRRTAVLVGLETDVCVAQSALGLQEAGWKVVVIFDAVTSPGVGHEQGLSRLRDAGVELLGTKAAAYDWLRTVAKAEEVLRLPALAAPRGIVLEPERSGGHRLAASRPRSPPEPLIAGHEAATLGGERRSHAPDALAECPRCIPP